MGKIEIDGSFGEGGGQILRTALSLSLLTGKAFRIYNLRAKREKPGLRPQHLIAVKSALKISGSSAEGAEIGSRELNFYPSQAKPGTYRIDIGTAGSTTLVFQTLLPVLLNLKQESILEIKGGTHNPKSPSFDFIQTSFLPLLHLLGIKVEAELASYGFYPRGGGEVRFKTKPWHNPGIALNLSHPAKWQGPEAQILLAGLEAHIAERERDELIARLGIDQNQVEIKFLPSDQGPGNVIILKYFSENRVTLFTGYGEKGKRAERVAQELAREGKNFSRSQAQLDPYLADQVLIYLAMGAGGEFSTSYLSSHFHTNLKIISEFLKIKSEIISKAPNLHLVKIIK